MERLLQELRHGYLCPSNQRQPPVPPGEGDPALHGPALRLPHGENQGTGLGERGHNTVNARDNLVRYLSGMSPSQRVCSLLPLFLCPVGSDRGRAQASVDLSSDCHVLVNTSALSLEGEEVCADPKATPEPPL